MRPLSGALPLPYVLGTHCWRVLLMVLWLLLGPCSHLIVGLFSITEPLCHVPRSVSLWNDLSDPVFDGVGLAGFKSRANAVLLAWSAVSFLSQTILSFSSFHWLVVWGWGLWTDSVTHSLSTLHSGLQIIIIIKLNFPILIKILAFKSYFALCILYLTAYFIFFTVKNKNFANDC